MTHHMLRALIVLLAALTPGLALAQDHRSAKPLQLVVPLAAGTTIDFVARLYAERLTTRLGQSIVVQNRPGAGGTIAAQSVAKAAADGTMFLIVNSQHSINTALYANLPYDTLADFTAVAMIAEAPSIIAAHPKLGVKTVKELIALGITSRESMQTPLAVAAVAQTDLPGFEYSTYYGFVAPAKIPSGLVAQLSQAIRAVTEDAEVRERLISQGMFPRTLGPAEFDRYIRSDIERIGPVVKAAGAKAN